MIWVSPHKLENILHVCPHHKFSTLNITVFIKFNGLVFNLKRKIEVE